jgi:serine/threonine protein kinase
LQKGESLDKWATHVNLKSRQHFVTILSVLIHLAQRLRALHEIGIVHRDLKPANVLWRPRAHEWTLIDFGCAAEKGATPVLFPHLSGQPS